MLNSEKTHPQPPVLKTGQALSRGELGVDITLNVFSY